MTACSILLLVIRSSRFTRDERLNESDQLRIEQKWPQHHGYLVLHSDVKIY